MLGDLGLLGRRGLAPLERLAIAAPALQHLVVGFGKPDEPEHGLAGQREREGVDELGRWRHRRACASISSWLRRRMYGSSDFSRRFEKPSRVNTRMRPWSGSGRFDITAIGSKSGAREHLGRLGAEREHRILDVGRRVHLGVGEHGDDVLHAADHHVAELARRRTPGVSSRKRRRSGTGRAGSRRRAGSTCGAPGTRRVAAAPRPGPGGSCSAFSSHAVRLVRRAESSSASEIALAAATTRRPTASVSTIGRGEVDDGDRTCRATPPRRSIGAATDASPGDHLAGRRPPSRGAGRR